MAALTGPRKVMGYQRVLRRLEVARSKEEPLCTQSSPAAQLRGRQELHGSLGSPESRNSFAPLLAAVSQKASTAQGKYTRLKTFLESTGSQKRKTQAQK